MNEKVHIDNIDFIPASQVAKVLQYTPDYISKLAREEKILSTRVGRRWYVNLDSALQFKELTEREKQARAEEIREERKLEQKLYRQEEEKVSLGSPLLALTETAVVVFLGLIVGFGGFFVIDSNTTPAAVDRSAFERLAIMVYDLFTIEKDEKTVSSHELTVIEPEDTRVSAQEKVARATTTFTTFIVAPDEAFTEAQVAEVRQSFSDEVEISIDPENPDTGIITPVFRDRRGEDYRFLMMPIPEPRDPRS